MPKLVHNPQTEELYHVAGDVPDPDGSALRGQQASLRLTKTALGHPLVRYAGKHAVQAQVMEMDVYAMPDGGSGAHLMVNWICPRCGSSIRTTSLMKQIQFDASDGRLSMERVACPWEMGADRQEFGIGMCRFAFAVDNNVAKDA